MVPLSGGPAPSPASRDFPNPVMGKTGTTSGFRDALFAGSTYGTQGITVAVRIGFDDNRSLGEKETGGRAALPIFREIMLQVYKDQLVGRAPSFPHEIEDGIDQYRAMQAAAEASSAEWRDIGPYAPAILGAVPIALGVALNAGTNGESGRSPFSGPLDPPRQPAPGR